MWPNINCVDFIENWQKFNFRFSYGFETDDFISIIDMLLLTFHQHVGDFLLATNFHRRVVDWLYHQRRCSLKKSE